MRLLKDLASKYGFGLVLGAATLDGYRRQVLNDRNQNVLNQISLERSELSELEQQLLDKCIKKELEITKHKAALFDYNESVDKYQTASDNYSLNKSNHNKCELNTGKQKLDESLDRISKLDISDIFISLYNKYSEFLDNLTPDKIVCLFNIIIEGLILSSFISIVSIMLSENIINKIVFLEKYPRILRLLKLRSTINKKVSKFYLIIHLFFIVLGILGNIYMYFI